MIKNLSSSSRYEAHFFFIEHVVTVHGKGFTTTCLTIGEYSAIVSVHYVFNHLATNPFKYLRLSGIRSKDVIESERKVAALSVKFFHHSYSFLILIKFYD